MILFIIHDHLWKRDWGQPRFRYAILMCLGIKVCG